MADYSTIWKFELDLAEHQSIEIPEPGVILDIQFQGDQLCLWAGVIPGMPRAMRDFCIVGTGRPMPDIDVAHVGTVQHPGGAFVWHLFERVQHRRGAIEAGDGFIDVSLPGDATPETPRDSRVWRVGDHYGIHLYAVNAEGEDEPIGTILRPELAAQVVREHAAVRSGGDR